MYMCIAFANKFFSVNSRIILKDMSVASYLKPVNTARPHFEASTIIDLIARTFLSHSSHALRLP